MNIPVTFLHDDSSDRFLVPVRVISASASVDVPAAAAVAHHDAQPVAGHASLTDLVREGLAEMARRSWSVQLPHRRFRRRQRARLRLAY